MTIWIFRKLIRLHTFLFLGIECVWYVLLDMLLGWSVCRHPSPVFFLISSWLKPGYLFSFKELLLSFKDTSALWAEIRAEKHEFCMSRLSVTTSCFRLCGVCGSRGVCASVWCRGGMLQHRLSQTGHWAHAERWERGPQISLNLTLECVFFFFGCEWTFPFVPHRFAWTHDRGYDGRPDVFADLHLQQQLHPLHHRHLEEAPPTGLGERAAPGGQVNAAVEGGLIAVTTNLNLLWGLPSFQDCDRDLDGGERCVDPHPTVGQQRPALRLHPVGDQLPRPARYRRLHPGRLLEEDQRAGSTLTLSVHTTTLWWTGVATPWPLTSDNRRQMNKSVIQLIVTERASHSLEESVLQKRFPQNHLEFGGLLRLRSLLVSLLLSSSGVMPHMGSRCQHLPEAAADFLPSCHSLVFRVVRCFPSPSWLRCLNAQSVL